MARNRLYIRDADTGHLLYLAKSNGPIDSDVGWWMCACTPDEFNEFMRAHQEVGPTGMPTTMELVTDVDDDNPQGITADHLGVVRVHGYLCAPGCQIAMFGPAASGYELEVFIGNRNHVAVSGSITVWGRPYRP